MHPPGNRMSFATLCGSLSPVWKKLLPTSENWALKKLALAIVRVSWPDKYLNRNTATIFWM